jgi:hypothetical protein
MKYDKNKPAVRFAHVGDISTDRDMTIRVVSLRHLLRYHGDVIRSLKVEHDYIDLSRGRDFLQENAQYDVVILHFIWGFTETPYKHPALAVSKDHNIERWRQRLISTGAKFIFGFGGSSELACCTIHNIEGYSYREYFEPPPVQYTLWSKND